MIPESMCSRCTPPVRRAVHREPAKIRRRPEIPSWTQWKTFLATRPLAHMRLCLMCLQPLDILCGIHKDGHPDTDTIRIGCRVKILQTEVFTVCNVDYEEQTQKIMPVSIRGLGCDTCQYFYTREQANEIARYTEEDNGYSRDLLDPGKNKMYRQYGATAPNKRQAMIDVTELVLEMVPEPKVDPV